MECQFGIMSYKWDGSKLSDTLIMYKSKRRGKRLYDRYSIKCLNSLSGKLRKSNRFDLRKDEEDLVSWLTFKNSGIGLIIYILRFTFTR